jgi:hypothetical protein
MGLVGDIAKGAVAGAAATWVMDQVTTYMYEREDAATRRREDSARGDRSAYEIAAERAAGAAAIELSEPQRQTVGQAIHWSLGVGAVVLYALLRRNVRGADLGAGLGFGLAFWLVADEVMVPALGLTPGPTAFPWQTHARGLAGHAALGFTADTALSVLDAVV